jgi:hypothetical protein
MAALALIGATAVAVGRGLSAQAPSPSQQPGPAPDRTSPPAGRAPVAAPKRSETHFPAVHLNLVVAGLGREGCDIEVKPANAGSRFRTAARQHVPSDGRAKFELRDVELRGADHTCTVAITVHEPGQAPKTIYRGFRLTNRASPATEAPAIPTFMCYLSSRLAGVDNNRTRR